MLVPHTPMRTYHAVHLGCAIAASVIARNVANQALLDAVGAQVLGKLYIAVSIFAGLFVALLGWLARGYDLRRIVTVTHVFVGVVFAGSFLGSLGGFKSGAFPIIQYVAVEVASAMLLLCFGLLVGASLGPREARRAAARVGLGGILGGLFAGAVLKLGAPLVGSVWLFVVAAVLTLVPIFWFQPVRRILSEPTEGPADTSGLTQVTPYGRWVAISTALMVVTTTVIDFQYRAAAAIAFDSDRLTSFFGDVTLLTGLATLLLQLTVVDRLLDRVGLFATATVMPGALIVCSAAFGLHPALITLVLLKLVDSGTNMSVQQATGGLLLAPLTARARAVWQSRIDGLARRGGQALAGLYLAAFPWSPVRLVPVVLVLCAMWLVCLLVTRMRYVELLTKLLGSTPSREPDIAIYDGATLRLLLRELDHASPTRAAVILDLLEEAGQKAPLAVLQRLADEDGTGTIALRIVEHLAAHEDVAALRVISESRRPDMAAAALMALAEIAPEQAESSSRMILEEMIAPEPLRALAAGVLVEHDQDALALCRTLATSNASDTRIAAARALGQAKPRLTVEVVPTLCLLVEDMELDVARAALAALGNHVSANGIDVAVKAVARRELRAAAMRALAEIGPAVVHRVAKELQLQLREPRIANALAWVLGRIGSPLGVSALVDALSSPLVDVRLSAAVALSTLHRNQPNVELPHDRIARRYSLEIEYFATMRRVTSAYLPPVPTAELLRRTARHRTRASLETLFRIMALRYPRESIEGAFRGFASAQPRQRQLALELLDNILAPTTRLAFANAFDDSTKKATRDETPELMRTVEQLRDRFLAVLARDVLIAMGESSSSGQGDMMTQSLVNQILELQALTLFSQCSAEDLAEVASLCRAKTVTSGAVLFRQGERGDTMYLIRSGAIDLARDNKVLDRLGPGDACGIIAVLDQLPRETTAVAVGECSLLAVDGDDLLQLLADRPLLMQAIFRALTGSIRNQLDRVSLEKQQGG